MPGQCSIRIYANSPVFFLCLKCRQVGWPKWPATVESFKAQKDRFHEKHQYCLNKDFVNGAR